MANTEESTNFVRVEQNFVHAEHNFVHGLGILGKVSLYFAVAATVLFFQISNRPKVADTYYTNYPNETTRGGAFYTCGCSLPSYLQKDTDRDLNTDKSTVNLNICYDSSRLETLTVLMYSESAARLAPELGPKIENLASSNTINRTIEGGYSVWQQAHDLAGFINDHKAEELPPDLANLYLNGIREREIYPNVKYLESAEFMSFPRSYIRLVFIFICKNCSNCSLKSVNDLFKKAVNGSNKDSAWASCFYWGWESCTVEHKYQAKCLLYPTEALPPTFAIRKFFANFMLLPDIEFGMEGNWTTLEPSSMYLNISRVNMLKSNSTPLQFVEVFEGSALWAWLLTMFPSLGNCADMHDIEVCNGTSVCNVFSSADSYDLRCLDMKDTTKCKTLMSGPTQDKRSTFDNSESFENPDWLDLECPKFSCETVPPYSLNWNTSEQMKDDPLNRFLTSTRLNDYWAQHSGVCTNTYKDVLRFHSGTPLTNASAGLQEAKRNNRNTIFLESKCANTTAASTYCWLTGNYHNMSDTPADDWKKLEDKNLFPDNPDRLFVCYRLDDQKFGSWFISTVGILFGWVGTVDLLLRSEGLIIIPLVNRFQSHMHARGIARIQRRLLQQDDPPQGSL